MERQEKVLGVVEAEEETARRDDLLAAIKAAVAEAEEGLPRVRYNGHMLKFLCREMKKVEQLLLHLPRVAPQTVLAILKIEMERASCLISEHAKRFDLRDFCKVNIARCSVEQLCENFRECLCELGLEKFQLEIQTRMDNGEVAKDERYICWYLTCILEDRGIDRPMSDAMKKNLEEQVIKQRHRMEFVTMISEKDIVLMQEIGKGGCGQVFEGRWKQVAVAIKMLKNDLTPESRAEFLSEVELHIQLSHPNVTRCFGALASNGIVMELASTDLERFYWSRGDEWDWPTRLRLMLGACFGLQHLHNSGIVHGDIKTANFLVFETPGGADVDIKISDFGLAATKTETRSKAPYPMAGTRLWMAPEVCEGGPQTFHADIFSFGLVLFELAALAQPYRGLHCDTMVLKRKKEGRNPVTVPEECPKALSTLMKRCIGVASCDRPTIDEVGMELSEILQQVKVACKAPSSDESSKAMRIEGQEQPPILDAGEFSDSKSLPPEYATAILDRIGRDGLPAPCENSSPTSEYSPPVRVDMPDGRRDATATARHGSSNCGKSLAYPEWPPLLDMSTYGPAVAPESGVPPSHSERSCASSEGTSSSRSLRSPSGSSEAGSRVGSSWYVGYMGHCQDWPLEGFADMQGPPRPTYALPSGQFRERIVALDAVINKNAVRAQTQPESETPGAAERWPDSRHRTGAPPFAAMLSACCALCFSSPVQDADAATASSGAARAPAAARDSRQQKRTRRVSVPRILRVRRNRASP